VTARLISSLNSETGTSSLVIRKTMDREVMKQAFNEENTVQYTWGRGLIQEGYEGPTGILSLWDSRAKCYREHLRGWARPELHSRAQGAPVPTKGSILVHSNRWFSSFGRPVLGRLSPA
jgi:hypothetical protein